MTPSLAFHCLSRIMESVLALVVRVLPLEGLFAAVLTVTVRMKGCSVAGEIVYLACDQ